MTDAEQFAYFIAARGQPDIQGQLLTGILGCFKSVAALYRI
jgi:hypothetical protein